MHRTEPGVAGRAAPGARAGRRAAAGRASASTPSPSCRPDEVRVAVAAAQPGRRVSFRQLVATSTAGDGARRPRRGARDRRRPGEDAEPGDRVGRHAASAPSRRSGPESPLGLRRRRPGRHPGVAVADPAADHRRPGPLGRPLGAGALPRARRSCSAARSPPSCPTTCPARWPWPSWTCAARPPLTARVVARYVARGAAARPSPCSAAPASPARCPWPPPGAPAPAVTVGVVPVEREAAGLTAPGSPTRSRWPTPATRWPCRRAVGDALGGRPTSRSSASTSPAASTARSSPRPTAGTVIFFSMATSFTAAALGAEGLAADVTMLVGNGYMPGHAESALDAAAAASRRPGTVRAAAGTAGD